MTIENSKFIGNRTNKGVGGAVYVDGANASGRMQPLVLLPEILLSATAFLMAISGQEKEAQPFCLVIYKINLFWKTALLLITKLSKIHQVAEVLEGQSVTEM